MKRLTAAVLCLIMVLSMAACGTTKNDGEVKAPESDVTMKYITVEDAAKALTDEGYVFFDVRKAADYATAHIPGALGYDMDAAMNGDFDAGVATMKPAIKDLDKKIVLVCYSGKRYAQASTNVLSALGYDMEKVLTLEGGFNAWTKSYADKVEVSKEIKKPESDVTMKYITVEDAAKALTDEGYVFFDVRKAADHATSHIPGALSYDMDAAKEGNFEAGVATMQTAIRGLDKKIVLVCYSGKRYAQASTNVLSALGYDMEKVLTLEGGFTAWSKAYPDKVEASK